MRGQDEAGESRLIPGKTQGGPILLSIRLTRMGAKKKPFYRIIVTEKRSKRDGRFV